MVTCSVPFSAEEQVSDIKESAVQEAEAVMESADADAGVVLVSRGRFLLQDS